MRSNIGDETGCKPDQINALCVRAKRKVIENNILEEINEEQVVVNREYLVNDLSVETFQSKEKLIEQLTDSLILVKTGKKAILHTAYISSCTPESLFIQKVQTLLNQKGYKLEVTNTLTQETKDAINSYSRKYGFQENALTLEFLDHIGYNFPNCICKQVEE